MRTVKITRAEEGRAAACEDGTYVVGVRLTRQQMQRLETLADSGLYGDGTSADAARELLSIAIRTERR